MLKIFKISMGTIRKGAKYATIVPIPCTWMRRGRPSFFICFVMGQNPLLIMIWASRVYGEALLVPENGERESGKTNSLSGLVYKSSSKEQNSSYPG